MEDHPFPLHDLVHDLAIMIVVRDLAVSLAFYQHRLGFTLLDQQAHVAALRCGTLRLYLFTHSPPTPDKPTITLTNLNGPDTTPVIIDLLVSDCQAAYERLQKRGVVFLTPPHTPPWGGLRCFARDPDGYLNRTRGECGLTLSRSAERGESITIVPPNTPPDCVKSRSSGLATPCGGSIPVLFDRLMGRLVQEQRQTRTPVDRLKYFHTVCRWS